VTVAAMTTAMTTAVAATTIATAAVVQGYAYSPH
jgi:hypothetical protein